MNRTIKEATIKAFHPDSQALQPYGLTFVTACNLASHLKASPWRTPFQTICGARKAGPSAHRINPHHLIPGIVWLSPVPGVPTVPARPPGQALLPAPAATEAGIDEGPLDPEPIGTRSRAGDTRKGLALFSWQVAIARQFLSLAESRSTRPQPCPRSMETAPGRAGGRCCRRPWLALQSSG